MPMHEIYVMYPTTPTQSGGWRGMSKAEFENMSTKPSNGFLSEDHFQIEAFQWIWNEPEFLKFRRSYLHPANEGEKNQVKANRDFSKGMIAGAADFIFLKPVFVIELKQPGKKLTENQEKFKAMCRSLDIPHYTVEYMADFQRIVRQHFNTVM